MRIFLLLLCVVAIIGVIAANDYCHMSCKDSLTRTIRPHIACHHNNKFNSYSCPRNAKMVQITPYLKKLLVDSHNKKRNFIAGGGDAYHRRACRMATMQWDEELAYLARLNVKQCRMEHDGCHNTQKFHYSGQNLALTYAINIPGFYAAEELTGAVQGWYNEVVNSTQYNIDSFPMNSKKKLGHFTVMMADRNNRMGCAAAVYSISGVKHFLTACNYATTNMVDHPIYAKCNVSGKHCRTRTNPKYPNLCNKNEQYDVNRWF